MTCVFWVAWVIRVYYTLTMENTKSFISKRAMARFIATLPTIVCEDCKKPITGGLKKANGLTWCTPCWDATCSACEGDGESAEHDGDCDEETPCHHKCSACGGTGKVRP